MFSCCQRRREAGELKETHLRTGVEEPSRRAKVGVAQSSGDGVPQRPHRSADTNLVTIKQASADRCVSLAVKSLQRLAQLPARTSSLIAHLRRVLPYQCKAFVLDLSEVVDILIEHGALAVAHEARMTDAEEEVFAEFEKFYLHKEARDKLHETSKTRRYDVLVEAMNRCEMDINVGKKAHKVEKTDLSDFVTSRLSVSVDYRSDLIQRLKEAMLSIAPLEAVTVSLRECPDEQSRILQMANRSGLLLTRRAVHNVALWIVSRSFIQLRITPEQVLSMMEKEGFVCTSTAACLRYNLPAPAKEESSIVIGDRLVPSNGDAFSCNDWKLPAGEVATVEDINECGNLKLVNPAGCSSTWCPPKTWTTALVETSAETIARIARGRLEMPSLAWTPHLRNPDRRVVQVEIPENLLGKIIGPEGATIKMFKECTHLQSVKLEGTCCELIGNVVAVYKALENLKIFLKRGYFPIFYSQFLEVHLNTSCPHIREIVGRRGATIRALIARFGVEICISNDKNRYVPWQTRLSTVTIAGSRPSVLECKTVVSCLLKHYHHELTHPGVTHATLEIHTKDNGLIIGDKGSELRHIQNNWKVRVIVPNFQPDKLNDVVVVGEPRNAKRAAEYIGRMLTRKRQELKEALEDGHDSDEAEFVVAHSRRTHESVTNRALAQRAHRHHEQHYKGAKNELHRVKAYNEHGDEIPRGREHHVHEVDSRKRDLARGRERDAKYEA